MDEVAHRKVKRPGEISHVVSFALLEENNRTKASPIQFLKIIIQSISFTKDNCPDKKLSFVGLKLKCKWKQVLFYLTLLSWIRWAPRSFAI